jgi:glycyl-tRNA synthetase
MPSVPLSPAFAATPALASFSALRAGAPGLLRAAPKMRARSARVVAALQQVSSSSTSAAPTPAAANTAASGIAGTTPLTFQDAILRLQEYWAERGCVLWHPHNTEVGAGTGNPATFLRVLGPEPWSVAYEEPSVRPDDSRYGENPNRLQCHTQFQVIVKPAPDCAQELVVGSYRALGIDVTKRDIRFVEDNWESPALGAWGLGWEVWLDGMEITQFTYFQQAGSLALDSVAVEITYGLERIIMALQGKTHFKDIVYAPGITYGEILMQNEVEMSKYNLDEADVSRSRLWFDMYEAEALQLLKKRLPVPAYNYLLKASHVFNVLDSRGAVGVTERARYFQRMRDLARGAAQLWVDRREELGFPLIAATASKDMSSLLSAATGPPPVAPSLESQAARIAALRDTCEFVFELGVEELPALEIPSATAQVDTLLRGLLADARLTFESVTVESTPRRIAAVVRGLQTRQADESRRMRGPPLRAAVDKDNNLTKAGRGFLKSQGVDPDADLSKVEFDADAGYMYATIDTPGRDAVSVVSSAIPIALVAKISFGRTMRWNDTGITFSRPIRWMLCLLDDIAIPFEFAGLASGTMTRTLRGADGFARDEPVASAAEYGSVLERNQIVLSRSERARRICDRSAALASSVVPGGMIPAQYLVSPGGLLDEVTDLVENPLPLLGRFDESYLSLPDDVLVTVMKKHQRYLPVMDGKGTLVNAFITVVNGDAELVDMDAIRGGNEAVLRARYSDAAFFYRKDTEGKRLADFLPVLDGLTFQEKLGSMLDKVARVESVTPALCELIGMTTPKQISDAQQVAKLFRADLGTAMVVEMTSLAGIMGRHYALRSGEVSSEVAEGIFDAALPRYSGDQLPGGHVGAVVAIADRLDSLTSLFSVGLMPKATADPFALRRAALGIVQTLIALKIPLNLRDAIATSTSDEKVAASVLDFIAKRLEAYLSDRGYRPDVTKAILAISTNAADPCQAFLFSSTLQQAFDSAEGAKVIANAHETHGRAHRLIKSVSVGKKYSLADNASGAVTESLFEDVVENALLAAIQSAENAVAVDASVLSRVRAVAGVKTAVDAFCDGVFVAADDSRVRDNRVAMLRRVVGLTNSAIDLTLLQNTEKVSARM